MDVHTRELSPWAKLASFLSYVVEKTSLNKVLRGKKKTQHCCYKRISAQKRSTNLFTESTSAPCTTMTRKRKLNGNKRAGERCIYLNLAHTNGSCSPEGTATTLGTQQLHWKAGVTEINDHMCGLRCLPKLMGSLSTLLLLAVRCWVSLAVHMSSLLACVISITVFILLMLRREQRS